MRYRVYGIRVRVRMAEHLNFRLGILELRARGMAGTAFVHQEHQVVLRNQSLAWWYARLDRRTSRRRRVCGS